MAAATSALTQVSEKGKRGIEPFLGQYLRKSIPARVASSAASLFAGKDNLNASGGEPADAIMLSIVGAVRGKVSDVRVLHGRRSMLATKGAHEARVLLRPIRPIELRQYRYFVVLAEELHFARAAERLCIGQSNLSREIRSLEHQVGLRLFFRTSRHTELSAAGERLLETARRVLAAEEHARLAIGELRQSVKERVRIEICERIACSRIATVIAAWRCANAGVELRVVSRSGRELVAELEGGLIDAGIAAMEITESGIVAERLWTDPWVVALPKTHALVCERLLTLAQLAGEPIAFLAPDVSCWLERDILAHAEVSNTSLFIAERPSGSLALVTWVEAGCGIGLLTASQAEGVVRAGVILRPLRQELPPARVNLLRGEAPPSSPLLRLIEGLRATSG